MSRRLYLQLFFFSLLTTIFFRSFSTSSNRLVLGFLIDPFPSWERKSTHCYEYSSCQIMLSVCCSYICQKKISLTDFIVTHIYVFKAQESLQYIVLLSIYRAVIVIVNSEEDNLYNIKDV
jgi:hypothetical protein